MWLPTRGLNWPPWLKKRDVTNTGPQLTSMIKNVTLPTQSPNWPPWLKNVTLPTRGTNWSFRCLDCCLFVSLQNSIIYWKATAAHLGRSFPNLVYCVAAAILVIYRSDKSLRSLLFTISPLSPFSKTNIADTLHQPAFLPDFYLKIKIQIPRWGLPSWKEINSQSFGREGFG